ncbi:hypothetical protein EB796_009959 [Bugula neritina]|uniref:Fibrinogen C-terminal domain-containing protein n=1 Tax=Bugula neritina TaxID=10212 RepID=A0A7J7JZE0_BUGNE|nr:hypothetical protein EB796_009959 [Bugula neritina]
MQAYLIATILLATSLQALCGDVEEYCLERIKTKPSCKPKTCLDLLCLGYNGTSGVYKIYPTEQDHYSFDVFCDQKTDGGGWTVFQRRMDGSVNFYRNWYNYKLGFGNLNGEFWLGNDKLVAALQANTNNELRFDLESTTNQQAYAKYSSFNVGDESTKYTLSVSGYTGTAGDSFTIHNGYRFSTSDHDNDVYGDACAVKFLGAWWYAACHYSNLNGKYLNGAHASFANGVNWKTWKGYNYSLKTTEMKFRAYL